MPPTTQSKLVEVCTLEDIGPADGATKSVEIVGTDPKRVVMLMRHKGGVLACNPACTKCKLPLMGAEIDDKKIRCAVLKSICY